MYLILAYWGVPFAGMLMMTLEMASDNFVAVMPSNKLASVRGYAKRPVIRNQLKDNDNKKEEVSE